MAHSWARAFYKSKAWQDTRAYIFIRDRGLCLHCGKVGEEVHHIIHLTQENILDENITLNPSNLELLCRDCHQEEHKTDRAKGNRTYKAEDLKELDKKLEREYVFDSNGYLVPRC